MRISTAFFFQRGTDSILQRSAELSKSQLHVATGRRIITPSDDPAGAAKILDFNRFIETTEQYQLNANQLDSRLSLQESVLTNSGELLQRARELAVQGNNATVDAAGKTAIAEEVDAILDQLLSLSNTRDANDEYLFSGFQRNTQAFSRAGGTFSYQGDHGNRELQISDNRRIADANTGFDIFMDIPASAGGTQDAFTTLQTLVTDLRANNSVTASINDLELAQDNILRVRTEGGARLNTIATQKDANEGFLVSMRTQLSQVEDLDYAQALTNMERDLLGLQAAQQSFVKIQGLSLFNFVN